MDDKAPYWQRVADAVIEWYDGSMSTRLKDTCTKYEVKTEDFVDLFASCVPSNDTLSFYAHAVKLFNHETE